MHVRSLVAAVLATAILAWPSHAHARPVDNPAYAPCVARAATAFKVPELALWVILDVERGTVGRVSQNSNGTVDIGPSQINSSWLPKLQRLGIRREQVLNDACVNIYVAAWIYAHEYQRQGDIAKAIATYHSPTPVHQRRYLGLVRNAIDQRIALLQQRRNAMMLADNAPRGR